VRDRLSEDDIIARYFAPLATAPGAHGLEDDVAVLAPSADELVLKTDAIVAGVHFFADDPADDVARKAIRVNLSDLAAKGAAPRGFLLALGLPAHWSESWLADFSRGLGEDAARYGCPLLGGDTVRSPERVFASVTVFGAVPVNRTPRRGGARPGDALYVSGTIGDAALGLRLRQDGDAAARWGLGPAERDHLVRRFRLPEPRLALAPALRRHATAAMDVSDGLAGDLAKLLRASRATGAVEVRRVPLSPAARRALDREPGLIEDVLAGGDDYEVLCAVAPEAGAAFERDAMNAGVGVARIGRVMAGKGPPLFELPGGEPLRLAQSSFSHF
jgi:thiamine-monophosphate kinase